MRDMDDSTTQKEALIIFVMGVSGAGKTTIGRLLADACGLPFYDGDDFHPAANLAKMSAGQPLDDHDRAGWLAALNELARHSAGAVIACSALKAAYRTKLSEGLVPDHTVWVFLQADYSLIHDRLQKRSGHFMPPALLGSQFEILEPPADALMPDLRQPPEAMVQELVRAIFANRARLVR